MDVPVTDEQAAVYQQILSLQLTWGCNAACRHCMVSGGPGRTRAIPTDEAKRIIDALDHLPLTRFVGFTGGEAFLCYDQLLELSKHLQTRFGYEYGIATNGFWATDDERAEALLRPLQATGLRELLVSLDDFHLEFIPGDAVTRAIRVARRLGIEVTVQTVITHSNHHAAWFQEHLDVPRPPDVRWVETRLHPAGRAISGVPANDYMRDWELQPGHCTALRVWNVDPAGWVAPCCGTAFAPPLRVGNAIREGLEPVVRRGNVDPIINTIAGFGGPYLLIKILERAGITRFSNRTYTSHCDACMVLLRDREAVAVLRRELEGHEMDALMSRLGAQTLWYRTVALGDTTSDWLPDGWLEDAPRVPSKDEIPARDAASPERRVPVAS